MRSAIFAALVASCLLAIPSTASAATTIHVPAGYPTIQAAIVAASPGDTVEVSPGTYTESIDFLGKDISVISRYGPDVTIIAGDGIGSTVVLHNGETNAALLRGFTVTGGKGNTVTNEGGGISIGGASPTVERNVIRGNEACSGGGVAVSFGSPIIQYNIVDDNHQGQCVGGPGGGGILVGGAAAAIVRNNVITNNSMGSYGGGITLFAAGQPVVENNLIAYNQAIQDAGGIWIVNNTDFLLRQNIIHDNIARDGNGGGVYWSLPEGSDHRSMINNTIVNNSAGQDGSQVFIRTLDDIDITNNIIESTTPNAIYCEIFANATTYFSNNIVFGPQPFFGGACADPSGTGGNQTADPLFVDDAASNYHLSPASPAIDAGTNAAALLPTDFDGLSRVEDGDGDALVVVDVGVDEWNSSDADGDGVPTQSDACDLIPGTVDFHGCPYPPPVGGFVRLLGTQSSDDATASPHLVAVFAAILPALAATAFIARRRIMRR